MSSCWGWLGPELGSFARVIAYDRAGLGWSDVRPGERSAAQVAAELRSLLQTLQIDEPLILVGHSLGALFNRAFQRQHPEQVRALVWLDPVHPRQKEWPAIRRRVCKLTLYLEAAHVLAARSVPAVEVPLVRHLDALPPGEFDALRQSLRNPAHLRASAHEARAWEPTARFAEQASLSDLPLLILSAQTHSLPHWDALQADLATLSKRACHRTFPEMSHLSMLAHPDHAAQLAQAIRDFCQKP